MVKEVTFSLCHPQRPRKGRGLCCACYQVWRKGKSPSLNALVETFRILKEKEITVRAIATGVKAAAPLLFSKKREACLKYRYGLTLEQYDQMFKNQDGVCKICRKAHRKFLYVDHCHTTEKIRGLLCPRCNSFMAALDVDPELFGRLCEYKNA